MRRLSVGIASERQLWLAYTLMGLTIVQSALVIWGNPPRVSAWLLMLLALGLGLGLLLPTAAGLLGGLATLAAWVLFRQGAGGWQRADLVQSVMELAGLSASIAVAVWFRRAWARDRQQSHSLQPLRRLIVDPDGASGLVSREVAELRLAAEVERARSSGRPLGIMLFEATPRSGAPITEADLRQAYLALARRLSNEVASYDVPFSDGLNRAGVIMPEQGEDELGDQAQVILEALAATVYVDSQGAPQPVSHLVRLDCGLTSYHGEAVEARDLMLAVVRCLDANRAQPEEGAGCRTASGCAPDKPPGDPSSSPPEGG